MQEPPAESAPTSPPAADSPPLELPDWAPQPIVDAWQAIDTYPLLGALVILAVSLVGAKLVQLFTTRGLTRLTAKTATDFDDKLIARLHRPIFVSVFFFGLSLAVRSLELPTGFTSFTVHLLLSTVVLYWLFAGFSVLHLVLEALGRLKNRFIAIEERTIPVFDIGGKLLLFGGASWFMLWIWGVDPTPWLASASVIGVAVGFAAKDTLANLFGGVLIIADAPYKIGDFVILDSGERGRVTHVGIRSTRLLTRDDIEIILPNAIMANAKIINESGGPWEKERVRIKVGVAYGSDVDQVCEVLLGIAGEHDHICEEPAPRVRMRAFGASGLDFELLCWIDEPVLRGRLSHDMLMDVYKTFAREGIEIPYSKHDVYLHPMPAADQ